MPDDDPIAGDSPCASTVAVAPPLAGSGASAFTLLPEKEALAVALFTACRAPAVLLAVPPVAGEVVACPLLAGSGASAVMIHLGITSVVAAPCAGTASKAPAPATHAAAPRNNTS
jgi:hypothetical protein